MGPADAGLRLDKFLAAHSGLSRGQCRQAIAEGGVWIGKQRVRRLSLAVEPGVTIELALAGEAPSTAPEAPQVLFEDRFLLALAKPCGLPTQGTLVSDQASVLGWAQRSRGTGVRTVHRLDVGTSGVLLLAKGAATARALAEQFRAGTVEKLYLALGVGKLPAAQGELEGRLRPAQRRGSFEVTAQGGVPAHTSYALLGSAAPPCPLLLIAARPRTGRTHQIRVHLAAAGAPLLGDARYGGPLRVAGPAGPLAATAPLLHAAEIRFTHPVTRRAQTIVARPPPAFAALAALCA